MSKKRGLSLDDKREKVLEVFHESADVFVLKDVEKIASKKGVVQQTIKDVLQSLVDDDLVHQEKIGSANYFWSFPAESSTKMANDVAKLEAELKNVQQRQEAATAGIERSKQGKQDSAQRAQRMAELRELQQRVEAQAKELQQYADSDPETVQAMIAGMGAARDAANRWLDNIYALQSWCKRKFEGREQELDAFFADNGAEKLEYVE